MDESKNMTKMRSDTFFFESGAMLDIDQVFLEKNLDENIVLLSAYLHVFGEFSLKSFIIMSQLLVVNKIFVFSGEGYLD